MLTVSTLPVSIRLALWATHAYAGRLPVTRAVARATPDLDDVTGLAGRLSTWHELGERVVLPALPQPGDLGALPRNDGALTAAATITGECVYVPGIGAALVCDLEQYGPEGDRGWALTTRAFDCEPVPRHRLEALSARDADRTLRAAISDATAHLARLGTTWGGGTRDLADAALAGGTWGLPDGLDRTTTEVITRAATVSTIVAIALESPDPSLTAARSDERRRALLALSRAAERSLEQATSVACLQVAGWLPTRS